VGAILGPEKSSTFGQLLEGRMNKEIEIAKFTIGTPVKHRIYGFRGVIFDVDPEFNNTEEWYDSIPADVRPRKDQPFYHLFAESTEQSPYIAYVSEQNLVPDDDDEPISHPDMIEYFDSGEDGNYVPRILMN
jgi:heat shock protein HspQ